MEGEITDFRAHPSGHEYFCIKDRRAQLQVRVPQGTPLKATAQKFTDTKAVTKVAALWEGYLGDSSWKSENGPNLSTELTVGDCAGLREVA